MASVMHPGQYHERRTTERRRFAYPALLTAEGMKVSWGGVFGGVLSAVGLLMLLTALGVAVGISAAQPGETEASTLGTGAGIWVAASLLISLFVGGLVSTRIGAITDGTTGFFEGALVWVVSVLLMLYLATSGVSMLAGGTLNLVGGAAQAMPSQTQQQAGDVAAQAKDKIGQAVESAKSGGLQQKAEEMKPAATRAAWITFGGLVLSLLAAVIGAMLGRREAAPPARG
ncbi:MAG TPA: hypothetical protein VF004_02725 [Burkholderiales bacterium]